MDIETIKTRRKTRLKGMSIGVCVWFFSLPLSGFTQMMPERIIEISADIYEYRLTSGKQLGIFYQYNSKRGSIQNSDIFLHGTENVTDTPIPALDLSGTLTKFSYGSIDYNLKMAIEEGRATILSNQRIETTSGKEASIISGQRIPITVIEEKGANVTLKTEFKPAGIKLIVKPYIVRENAILMQLEIESSEITQIETFDRGDQRKFELPVITKRNVRSIVVVPDQSPVYIAGLYTDNTGDITRKVPVLGDMPVVGFFLRGYNKNRRQTETIFKITPHIKTPGMGIDPTSSVFEELLQGDEGYTIINQQKLKTSGMSSDVVVPATPTIDSTTDKIEVESPLKRLEADSNPSDQSSEAEKKRTQRSYNRPTIEYKSRNSAIRRSFYD